MDPARGRRTSIALLLVGAASIAGLLWWLDPFGGASARGRASSKESDPRSPGAATADGGAEPSTVSANDRAGAERVAIEPREPETSRDGLLSGQVVDAHGKPIAGASVIVSASSGGDPIAADAAADLATGAKRLRTDAEGRFALPLGGFAGPLDVVADAEGFELAQVTDVRGGEPVVISLRTEPRIHGHVRDPEGAPIAGATVTSSAYVGRTRIERTTTSGEDGAYDVTWFGESRGLVDVEMVTLIAEKEGHAPDVVASDQARLRRDFDGTLVCDLVLTGGFLLEGRVLDAVTRQGVPDAGVILVEPHANSGSSPRRVAGSAGRLVAAAVARTARDGSFRFERVASRGKDAYARLLIRADGHADAVEQLPRAKDGERSVVEIALFPRVVVIGRVVDGAGVPIVGVTAHLTHPADHARGEPWLLADSPPPVARSDRDGRFTIETARPLPDAPHGELQLSVEITRGWVAAATGERRVPVDFAAESPIDLGDLTFERPPQFELRIVDVRGRPIAGAEFRMDLHGPGERADAEGRLIRNVAQGTQGARAAAWAFVVAAGYAPTLVGPLPASSRAGAPPLEVRLSDATTFSGVVRGAKEGEVLGLVLELGPELRLLEPEAAPPESKSSQRLQLARIVAPELPFRVDGLPAGPCEIHVVNVTPRAPNSVLKTMKDVPSGSKDLVIDLTRD